MFDVQGSLVKGIDSSQGSMASKCHWGVLGPFVVLDNYSFVIEFNICLC